MGEAAKRIIRACALASAWAVLWAPSAHCAPRGAGRGAGHLLRCARRIAPPHSVITGEFDTSLEGATCCSPSTCPPARPRCASSTATTSPRRPTNAPIKHVLDIGIYDARPAPGALGRSPSSAGWGGSSHPDVTVSRNGFSSEAQYLANPKLHRHGQTTRGFEPGPIPAGEWAVELGVAAVASQTEGDSDGQVAWRVEIDLSSDPLWDDRTLTSRATYDETPARARRRLVRGRLPRPRRALLARRRDDDARRSTTRSGRSAQGGAGLDFITLSDYVTDSAWGEIGRYQPDYPGKLIVRSAEVITYRGHANNHASAALRRLPHRSRLRADVERRPRSCCVPARPASAIFDGVHARRGLHADQPPDDLPLGGPRLRLPLPRLPLGLQRRARPTTEASTRSRSRPARRA